MGSILVPNDASKFHPSTGTTSKLNPVVLFPLLLSIIGQFVLIQHWIDFHSCATFVMTLLSCWFVIVTVLQAPSENCAMVLDRYTTWLVPLGVCGVRVQRINPAWTVFCITSLVPLFAIVKFMLGVENCATL